MELGGEREKKNELAVFLFFEGGVVAAVATVRKGKERFRPFFFPSSSPAPRVPSFFFQIDFSPSDYVLLLLELFLVSSPFLSTKKHHLLPFFRKMSFFFPPVVSLFLSSLLF